MTVKANDLPTNNLYINEIEQNTSPNSLELGSGKEGEYTYSKTLAKLLDVVAGTGIWVYPSTCTRDYGFLFS